MNKALILPPIWLLLFATAAFAMPEPSELGRILSLLDLLNNTNAQILYKGNTYEPKKLRGIIKVYIANHYKNEKAEDWIYARAYKSRRSGSIYYLKYPDGTTRLLGDVLLEELRRKPGSNSVVSLTRNSGLST